MSMYAAAVANPNRGKPVSREYQFMLGVLDKHHAGMSGKSFEEVEIAFRNLHTLLAGRLVMTEWGFESFGWALRKPELEHHYNLAPFTDHRRAFIDKATGGRVWTSQPYFPAHDHTTEDLYSKAEEGAEWSKFVTPFKDMLNIWCREDWSNHPQWVGYRQAVIDRVQRRSQMFVDRMVREGHAKRGLSVEVFGPERSFYYPGKTILIVYREQK